MVTAFVTAAAPAEARQIAAVYPQAYTDAIDAYANGRTVAEAVTPLKLWTQKDLAAAVDRLILTRHAPTIEIAAILQLEIGLGVMTFSPDDAGVHFELGEKLLKSLRQASPGLAELERWSSTWLGVAGSAYLAVTDTSRARPWIQKALQLMPQSAALRTIEGSAHEIDANLLNPDRSPKLAQQRRDALERRRRLTMAEQSFREAVAADASYARGHIRLGRALSLLGQMPRAREEIERGQALANTPDDRYLAALFMGAIQQQQKDSSGARESYERALTIAPQSQTATIALAYLDSITGRPDRAHALARSFAADPAADAAWWAYKSGGVDFDGLASLRARVQR